MDQSFETIDLTSETEFEPLTNPFLEDIPKFPYHLRSRIHFKLNRIKMLIQEMEHDLAIGLASHSSNE